MATQKFYADPDLKETFPNGAVGYRPTAMLNDCLGPFAKVVNCPIAGTDLRLTCYATGYADTFFSIPAATKFRHRYVGGYFTMTDGNIEFRVLNKFRERIGLPPFTQE